MLEEEFDAGDFTCEETAYEKELGGSSTVPTTPSQFTRFAIRVQEKGVLKNFSYDARRYLLPIYDSAAQRKIIVAGRQVEKSTLLGNMSLSYMALTPGFRVLYVSPSNSQTKVFSRDRIKEPIDLSPILKNFTNSRYLSNVLEKQFINRSKITLRFAFLNADRTRGIPADKVIIDEVQDIITDNIPVIEECASHSAWKLFTYAGTPKSLDGSLEHYWSKYSTQNEWVVPCRAHGTPNNPSSWHWNVLDEDNIGKTGLICDRCHGPISAQDPSAQWASLNPRPRVEKPFEGYRIPQLMVPWIEWGDIVNKQRVYSRAKYHNEVLGRSFDSGTRPLTKQDVLANCDSRVRLGAFNKIIEKYSGNTPLFIGVDWGSGESSYTVMVVGGYMPWDPDLFSIFFVKRFEGAESEPERQIAVVSSIMKSANIMVGGFDYGGGHWPNDQLIRMFGTERIKRYQWVGNVKQKLKFDPKLGVPRFLCHRTEIMSDFFNAVKRKNVFRFPSWEDFEEPYSHDFLNVFSEYNDRLRMNVYRHAPGSPDDTVHASIYCFLASFFHKKRPDVILPTKESETDDDSAEREELDVL